MRSVESVISFSVVLELLIKLLVSHSDEATNEYSKNEKSSNNDGDSKGCAHSSAFAALFFWNFLEIDGFSVESDLLLLEIENNVVVKHENGTQNILILLIHDVVSLNEDAAFIDICLTVCTLHSLIKKVAIRAD